MQKYPTNFRWPTKFDYDIALDDLRHTIIEDTDLRNGRLVMGKTTILHLDRPDSHTCLYRIDNWIVRCFCRVDDNEPNDNIDKRYQQLSNFCHNNLSHVSALIDMKYIERGMKIDFYSNEASDDLTFIKSAIVPIIKMPYIQAPSLGGFIATNYRNTHTMTQLCDAWLAMIREMEAVHMAHGDLDLTNVLVEHSSASRQLQLKLIDYDNTWIPDFAKLDYLLPEYGHESFQHPSFFGKGDAFNDKIDRFAALVIYISLKALISRPELYIDWEADDTRLLFSSNDYKIAQRSSSSGRIAQLQNMHIPGLAPFIDELCQSLYRGSIPESLISLSAPFQENNLTIHKVTNELDKPIQPQSTYREIVITEWDNVEYFNHKQNRSLQSAPLPHLELMPTEQAPTPTPVKDQPKRTAPPSSLQKQPMQADYTYSSTERMTVAKEAAQGTADRVPGRPSPSDAATWIGCGLVLLLVLIVLVIIIAIYMLNSSHPQSPHSNLFPWISWLQQHIINSVANIKAAGGDMYASL